MTAKLSDEQKQALDRQPGQPLQVEDPETHQHYVLIQLDVYQQLQNISHTSEDASQNVPSEPPRTASGLPDWCNVYEGLTDEQIADSEEISLQRADLTRPS